MFTRQVRDAILAPRTTFMSVRAELGYVGFRRVGIEYLREQRKYGQTHYNLWRMTVYALLSILSGTTFPLRLVMYLAVLVAIAFPLYTLTVGLSAAEASVTASIFAEPEATPQAAAVGPPQTNPRAAPKAAPARAERRRLCEIE